MKKSSRPFVLLIALLVCVLAVLPAHAQGQVVTARVDRVGLLVNVSFNDGNLGLFGLSPRFKPPTGIGLAINGPGVAGGGFLFFDAAKAEREERAPRDRPPVVGMSQRFHHVS